MKARIKTVTTENKSQKKKSFFSSLMENNKAVFVMSVIVAVMCWCAVSMYQAPETEKVFQDVKVQINLEGSSPYNNGLELFGTKEFYIDVTVAGKSYIINDSSFVDNISASVSLSSVNTAGIYSLPVSVKLLSDAENAEITNLSSNYIEVYFDEPASKAFNITVEIEELAGYSLMEGFTRENPRASVDSVTLTGPALEINKVVSVKAVAELNEKLSSSSTLEAKIIPVGSSENITFPNVTVETQEAVYITVPVSFSGEYSPIVTFSGLPSAYKTDGIKYSVYPSKVNVTLSSADDELINADEILIGSIDFSQLNNSVNYIKLSTDELSYAVNGGISEFVVTIDMSSMEKRWMEIPVECNEDLLPEGAKITTTSIESVQIIGPSESVGDIDSSAAYAVPVLDGISLEKGENTVPAKIILRTLTDSWVRGEYTITIVVE